MSNQYFVISKWETDRLRGLSPYARIMYTEGFAQRCDYDTGSFTARMNRQAWWELLSFEADWGSKKDWNRDCGLPNPHKQSKQFDSFVRARRDELVRAGLLEKVSSYQYLLLAYRDSGLIRSKKEHAKNTPKMHPLNTSKLLKNNNVANEEHATEHAKNTPPHSTTNYNSDSEFAMNDDWHPDTSFPDFALLNDFSVKEGEGHRKLMLLAIEDVRAYWQSGEAKHRRTTQKMWHKELVRTMKVVQAAATNVTPIEKSAKAYKQKKDSSVIEAVPNFRDEKALRAFSIKYKDLGANQQKGYKSFVDWSNDLRSWRAAYLASVKQQKGGM